MTLIGYSNVLHVTIGGRPLTRDVASLLVGGWVDFGAGVPGAFELTFRDPKKTVLKDAGAKIGKEIVIAPVADGQGARSPLITAEITGLEADYDGLGTMTVIRGYDAGHRLLRQRRVIAYRNMTASDIARDLAGTLKIGTIDRTRTVYEYISQANVTDWDFLCRLADDNERVLSIDSDGRFQFAKAAPASGAPPVSTPSDKSVFVLEAGIDILRCRAAVTAADQVTSTEARGWDVRTKRDLVGKSPATSNPGFSIGTTPAEAVKRFGRATIVETDTPYDKQSEVKNAASALADDVTGAFAEVQVTVHGNPKLRPGVPIALADVGEPFEGKYTVTAARHTFGDGSHYETYLTVSGRQWRSLFGLTSGGASPSARLPSVANALVTDVKDPLMQGRVKLRFPWLDDTYTSDWTRTVQFGGTKGGGIIAPDPGDEVLVAFDRGALDHPFVIGGLYNGRDKPGRNDVDPYDKTSGRNVRRTLADRSRNRIDLLDERMGGSRGVRISSGDDRLTINLDRTQTEITVDSKGSVTIKGTRSVSVEAGKDLSLKAGGRVSIKSGGVLDIEAAVVNARSLGAFTMSSVAAFNLSAFGELGLNCTGLISLSAIGSMQLQAVASIGIKAATVPMLGDITANTLPVV